jgi:hypothetical protein
MTQYPSILWPLTYFGDFSWRKKFPLLKSQAMIFFQAQKLFSRNLSDCHLLKKSGRGGDGVERLSGFRQTLGARVADVLKQVEGSVDRFFFGATYPNGGKYTK